jgi:DNA-binding transcriptional regulator YiaG
MNLSQSEFCDRYGLLLETYKKWEQGARALDAVVVLYLEMILIDPEGMAGMVQKVNWRRQLKAA